MRRAIVTQEMYDAKPRIPYSSLCSSFPTDSADIPIVLRGATRYALYTLEGYDPPSIVVSPINLLFPSPAVCKDSNWWTEDPPRPTSLVPKSVSKKFACEPADGP